ncbi:MAG: tripartite tricarboxylate transporter substrate binding protein [Chloroflexi bacterium]|nr:tripartite tricarboxylate transporter substrate binding protein [Chloroflexota bacterium]
MMRSLISGFVLVLAVSLMAGCAPAANPAPTAAPAPPTKAPAAAPTAAPAPPTAPAAAQLNWPEKGKSITILVPWDPGSGADVLARLLVPALQKDLGVPVEVVDKPGGGTQIGLTELATSKPDGYTIGMTNQTTTVLTYLDPARKAAYGRKDFAPIANVGNDTTSIAVAPNSPFKTLKDLVDAAKANPGKVTIGDTGMGTSPHLDLLRFAKAAGIKVASVHFSGGATAITAVLGGHVDATDQGLGTMAGQVKGNQVRVLGVMAAKRSRFASNAPTMEEQGWKVYGPSTRSFSAPGGTPKAIVDRLAQAFKNAMNDPDVQKKMDETMLEPAYMGPDEFSAAWDQWEKESADAMQLLAAQQQQ